MLIERVMRSLYRPIVCHFLKFSPPGGGKPYYGADFGPSTRAAPSDLLIDFLLSTLLYRTLYTLSF